MKQYIAFTGGHHNSTLVVAKSMHAEGYPIVWFGHKYTSVGDHALSAEYQEVIAQHFTFLELKTGKFYRKFGIEWFKLIIGFLQSFWYLVRFRPALVFSSGGYLSVPVVISAWLLRIPSVTHEQTVVSGWANKIVSPFVRQIMLTHPDSLAAYPKSKSVVVGLPIREELLDPKHTRTFEPPLLYITCGKQGSHNINQVVFPLIPELVKHFTVVHQTGGHTDYNDHEKARSVQLSLGDLADRYVFAPYFFSPDVAIYMRSAQVVVCRSGAHTCYELMVLDKNAVLIPISWVSHNEQLLNAQMVAKHTNSTILEEANLTTENLLASILSTAKQPTKVNNYRPVTNAIQKILQIIHQYLA